MLRDCTARLQTALANGGEPLSAAEMATWQVHARTCAECAAELSAWQTLDGQLRAWSGENDPAVERVTRIVAVTALPDAPDIVTGVVNVSGEVIAVVDIRKRFRLPDRATELSDHLIVARTSRRAVALVADTVTGVVECDEGDVVSAEAIVPGMEYIEGVARLKDGMLLIHDLESLLSLEEDRVLHDALGNT